MNAFNNLGRLLRGHGIKQKVIGKTPRDPVNKQAALITRPANWISRPIPVIEKTAMEFEAEIAELKNAAEEASYRENALNKLVSKLRDRIAELESENLTLRTEFHKVLKQKL